MQNLWLLFSRSRWPWLVGAAAALFVASAAHASPRQIASRVHERGGYPDKLHIAPGNPGYASSGSKPIQRTGTGWRDKRSSIQHPPIAATPPSSSVGLLDMSLLALVLAGLVVLAAWLLSRRLPPPQNDGAATDDADPVAVQPGDPDALAAAGRLEEAMRAVLLRALENVGWSAYATAGMTAREVVRGLDGADARRAPLRAIVRHAESVCFGNATPTQEGYAEMRALLERVAPSRSAS